jgi:adenylate kinase family enzyme
LIHTPENERLNRCPKCGGKLFGRYLDKSHIIKVRIKEYETRTKPIYNLLKERGIKIYKIDGEPTPDVVTRNISRALKLK